MINTKYPGKALGGIVLALERRARWYQEAPLFEHDWDRDRWETCYRLDPQYKDALLIAIGSTSG